MLLHMTMQAILVGLRATCYTSNPWDFFQCPRAALNYSQKNPTDKNLNFCFSILLVVVGLINKYFRYTTEH